MVKSPSIWKPLPGYKLDHIPICNSAMRNLFLTYEIRCKSPSLFLYSVVFYFKQFKQLISFQMLWSDSTNFLRKTQTKKECVFIFIIFPHTNASYLTASS